MFIGLAASCSPVERYVTHQYARKKPPNEQCRNERSEESVAQCQREERHDPNVAREPREMNVTASRRDAC